MKFNHIIRWTIIFLLLVSVLLPFVPLIIWSFSHRWYFPALWPAEWSWRAWEYVISPTTRVMEALLDSLIVGLAVTGLSILIGLPAGRAMGLYRFRGQEVIRFLILTPTIVPPIAVAMGIHVMFIRYGLADTLLGVILVHLIPVTPYMVLVMASVFANYNPDYEGQARTLGASSWQVFRYITLPAIRPGIVVGGFFAFIISWSQYILTLLIGGGQVITLPILLFTFANSGDYPITAALSLIFIAPALLFILVTSRYLSSDAESISGFGKL